MQGDTAKINFGASRSRVYIPVKSIIEKNVSLVDQGKSQVTWQGDGKRNRQYPESKLIATDIISEISAINGVPIAIREPGTIGAGSKSITGIHVGAINQKRKIGLF